MRKKILSLVLAVAMMMSLFVVGAGATSFKDDKDISNKDAVEKMASLNIIIGRDNGNFDPKGIVTRAEMCKMICVALNGGNDPKLSSSSVVTATFADTKGHWAEGYIEYCVNMGIVAGMGDKTFAPDQTVTASQASKMLLVALGYDASFEKFTGTTWAINTNKVAMQKGLYDDIMGIDSNAPMTRDAAAMMVNNFCSAPMVKYEFGISGTGTSVTGVKQAEDIKVDLAGNPQTILNKFYKLVTVKGTMTSMNYDKTKAEYGYEVIDQTVVPNVNKGTFYSKTDYSAMFGMKVELMFKDKAKNTTYDRSDDAIYDINADGSKLIAEGYLGDFSDSAFVANDVLKFGGVKYDIDGNTVDAKYFVSGGAAAAAAYNPVGGVAPSTALIVAGVDTAKIRLLDVNNNGKVDKIIVTPFNVEKVTYVGSDNATVTGNVANKKFADMTSYTGIAKDDQACVFASTYSITQMPTLVKAEIKNGKITSTKGTKLAHTDEYKIGDVWYSNPTAINVNLNDVIDYVAFGDQLFYGKVKEVGSTSKDIATVVNVGLTTGGADANKIQATLQLTNDTTKTVIISKVNGATATYGPLDNAGPVPAANTVATKNGSLANTNVEERVGELVTYVVDTDGKYELTDVTSTNLAGMDGVGNNTTYDDKMVGGKTLDDKAIVIVVTKAATGNTLGNDSKIYTGKEIKNTYGDNAFGAFTTTGKACLYKEVNGFNYAQVVVINNTAFPTVVSASSYGYLVADVGTSSANSKNYLEYSYWNGKEVVTAKEESTDSTKAALTKGTVIGFDNAGTGLIKNVSIPVMPTVAIQGYEEGKATGDIQFSNGVTSKIDSDTVVLFVDSDKKTGATNVTEIMKANDRDGDGNVTNLDANARYLVSGTSVKVIVIDSAGNMRTNPVATANVAADAVDTAAELNALLASYTTVNVTGNVTLTANLTIATGKTLNVTGNFDTAGYTVDKTAAGATLIVSGTYTLAPATTAAVVNAALVDYSTVVISGNYDLNVVTNIAIPVNKTLTVTGTLTMSAAGQITGAGKVKANAVTAGDFAALDAAIVEITTTAAIADLNAIDKVAGKILILGADSTGNALTVDTWFNGVAPSVLGAASSTVLAADGTASAAINAAVVTHATYKYGTYGFSANNVIAADVNGWFIQ